jgi:DNA-binding MarR family transcriptional regulator
VTDFADKMARECLALRARRLDRLVTRVYNDAARPFGLTVPQVHLLVGIAKAGPVQAQHLGRALDLEKSTLSRSLKLLADQGWITRDRALELTAAGRKLLERIYPAWEKAQAEVKAKIGADAARTLDQMAAGLRDG